MESLTVLDQLSLPGRPDKPNDDTLGYSGAVAFVLDGATGLGDTPLMPGVSDAAWVAHAVRDGLMRHAHGMAGDLAALCRMALLDVEREFEAQRHRETFERYEIPWATLVMIGMTRGEAHIAFLGDSRILVQDPTGPVHHFGAPLAYRKGEQTLASSMIAKAKETGHRSLGIESIRDTVMPQLRRARSKVNTSEGYWLAGPDARSAHNLAETKLKLEGPAVALLMTDGFYALAEDYGVYDDRSLIAAAQSKGLAALGRELRAIEDADPMGARFPRMKKSDDATALLVQLRP